MLCNRHIGVTQTRYVCQTCGMESPSPLCLTVHLWTRVAWLTISHQSDIGKFWANIISVRSSRIISGHHTLTTGIGINWLVFWEHKTWIWGGNTTVPPTNAVVLAQSSRHYMTSNWSWLSSLEYRNSAIGLRRMRRCCGRGKANRCQHVLHKKQR